MLREAKFVQSHRPYAVDLASLHVSEPSQGVNGAYYWCRVGAVWFRRRNGATVACIGELRHLVHARPADAAEFLTLYDDGRYGGDCKGRWDGARYWGAQEPDVAAAHIEILRPMLAGFPAPAPGYDGWWRF